MVEEVARLKPKRELSGADVRLMVSELQALVGSRVDKIYEIEPGIFLFRTRGKEAKHSLLLDPRGFLFISTRERETPKSPSSFAMLLRKHISGGRIDEVIQHRFDRIVVIGISTGQGRYSLIMELFGGGNLILVQDDIIIMPLRHKTWSHRTIRPRQEYVLPPDRPDPTDMDEEGMWEILSISSKDVVRALATDLNVGGEMAEEICRKAGMDKNIPASEATRENAALLFSAWQEILDALAAPKTYIAGLEETPIGFSFLPLSRYEEEQMVFYESLSACVEEYYGKTSFEVKETATDRKREKLQRQMEQQKDGVATFKDEEDLARRKAQALYIQYARIEKLLSGISEARKQDYAWKEIKKEL
ncbi:MAG: NFACT family protein, partial [Thermoplasmata archaeon]|nr:NFACT family protein [Thermoplasmata archaeon]